MEEIASFFDMLSACREKMSHSTNLQGLMKTLRRTTQFFEAKNSNNNNRNNFKSNSKTTTIQSDNKMENINMEATNAKKETNKTTEHKANEDNMVTMVGKTNTAHYNNEDSMMYWKNKSASKGSDSESDEEMDGEWETVEKKMKKKTRVKKNYVNMHVKKNDIKHAWKNGEEVAQNDKYNYKSSDDDSSQQKKVSDINKFLQQKKMGKMKTTNTKDLMKYMKEIGINTSNGNKNTEREMCMSREKTENVIEENKLHVLKASTKKNRNNWN
jgi:hypothetical protein